MRELFLIQNQQSSDISAAENGCRVIAFEKSQGTGGAANMGMGPFAVGSPVQRNQMVTITPGEAFRKHMFFTHYRVNARLVRDYYYKSGDTIQWLMDMGVQFAGAQRAFSADEATRPYAEGEFTWHVVQPEDGSIPGPRATSSMTKRMTEYAVELGVEFVYESPVHKIIMKDGKAVGVLAKNAAGEEIEARAAAVILATGDGLRMAWEAGAGKVPPSMELMYQLPNNMEHFVLDGAFRQPCLWVNRNGDR